MVCSLIRSWVTTLLFSASVAGAQAGFSLDEALRQPHTVSLSAAPVGASFAWIEVEAGRHNLWAGAPGQPPRALTHYTADDGQSLRELTWFPDGKTLAFTRGSETGADGQLANAAHLQPPPEVQVWTLDTAAVESTPPTAGHPLSLAPRLVGEGHSPLPLADGKHLLIVRRGQIWTSDLSANGPLQQAVFDRGSASQLVASPDSDLLAFISRRDHNHSLLALFDRRTGVLSFPAASTGIDSAPVFSPDGRQLAWLRSPWTDAPEFAANRSSPNPWSIQVLDLATGQVRTVFAPAANGPGSVLPHVSTGEPRLWWTAGMQLLFASEADGWLHLYTVDPAHAGTAPRLLTPGSFEVEDPVVSRDGRQLAYAANAVLSPAGEPVLGISLPGQPSAQQAAAIGDTDRRHLWLVDLATPDARPRLLTPGERLETHPVFSGDGTAIAALQAGVRTPTHPIVLKRGGGPSAPGVPGSLAPAASAPSYARFVTPQPVLFPSADALFSLHAQLFLPSPKDHTDGSPARHAALLFFHGGPRRQMLLGLPPMEYYARAYLLNQYFASRGFLVLSVNYRRGIGYGLDFREAANTGADGAAEYNDLLGALAYLRSRKDVDPERIGLWGESYGGYLTALGLARNSDSFAAGVDYHGVHDWILEDNRGDWLRGTAAEQAAIAIRAHASSPLADVDRWKSPVLLVHGDNDADVAYAQTPVLADALRARGVHTEELIFPDELHEFLLYRDWLTAYEATASFFERELHPER